jgi:hypothetical protein
MSALNTATILDYIELLGGLFCGLWVLLDFLHNRRRLHWRNATLLLFGVVLLGLSGMSFYVVLNGGLAHCAYPLAFRIVKRLLVGAVVVITVTVVLPAKKAPAR